MCDCEVQHTILYYDEGQILEHCTLCKKGGGCVVLHYTTSSCLIAHFLLFLQA